MPKKFDEILATVKRNNKGKTNPQTKKPYTDSELYAIAQSQYKKTKSVHAKISKSWEEEEPTSTTTLTMKSTADVNKSGKITEKGNQRFIEVIVSGLETDRQNEKMSQDAISDMIEQFKSGTIPFFFDHGMDEHGNQSYPWKGIGGVWIGAKQEGDHLRATARLNKAHPDHELFWNYCKEDMPVGFSLAGMPGEPATFENE
jgi:hypothetical protein